MGTPILRFKPIDLKDLDLTIQFREDSFICSFGSKEKFEQERESYIAWIQEKLEKDPYSAVHIWQENRIIGQMELGIFKPDQTIGYINLYYIIPELRGSGISHQLDEYAVEYLRSKGHTKARLSVSPANPRAVRYYTRMGWSDIGMRPDAPEVHFMEKSL